MDYSPIINQVFKLWWLLPIMFIIGFFKTPWFKGQVGEALVRFAAKLRLPEETYQRIHNVTLPTPDGTTQIDHIFVSPFGIFVVETKNMKGWIFGNEKQAQWTQKIYKKSFKFQNPLRQNYKHVKALEAALDLPPETIHSVVVFTGESTFKTPMPANVTAGMGYIRYIKSFTKPVLNETQVTMAVSQIASGRLAPTLKTHRQHVQQLKTRADKNAERKCPKCGSSMVLRTVKRGENAGKEFWGCSGFPKCRVVQDIH
ncbi:NERD domain-containing protein [Reinekea marinisedimentorum]|uniref:Topoisomerase-like DNA binding C4 zinc finger protein n=1 Tax=Reinekea marinisedimentorum TaxID=230495 RepID=A0A4R3HTL4_9GAMM|nr:NERD domain-containing protein [Reinekea marinisedimentorum]TCS36412.1 topoisomerase-like DNA binding C4 zinc finger protein [Reinekea marinisedimentorum]